MPGEESGSVTVSCAASLDEIREANRWLFTHDRAYFGAIFRTIIAPASVLCGSIFLLTYSVAPLARATLVGLLVVALVQLRLGLRLIFGTFTIASHTFARSQREGPTILTVSAAGLQWENQAKCKQLPWKEIAGYAKLPNVLVFTANPPFMLRWAEVLGYPPSCGTSLTASEATTAVIVRMAVWSLTRVACSMARRLAENTVRGLRTN